MNRYTDPWIFSLNVTWSVAWYPNVYPYYPNTFLVYWYYTVPWIFSPYVTWSVAWYPNVHHVHLCASIFIRTLILSIVNILLQSFCSSHPASLLISILSAFPPLFGLYRWKKLDHRLSQIAKQICKSPTWDPPILCGFVFFRLRHILPEVLWLESLPYLVYFGPTRKVSSESEEYYSNGLRSFYRNNYINTFIWL